MKRYTDPEMEIVCFEIDDVTNFDDGDENEFSFNDDGKNAGSIDW